MTLVSPNSDAACIRREPAELAPAWSALASSRQPPSIFLTPEWIAVARAHARTEPITLAIGDRGVAALAREADGTVTFAGGELSDEQDVIARLGDETEVAAAVARWVASERPPRVRLEYVPEEPPTLDAFTEVLTDAGYRVARARQIVSPVLDLPDSYEAYVRSLGKKERHELRRKVRRLESAGRATFRFASDAERATVIRDAIASRYGRYDLLRGGEPYKYDLGARDRWLARLDAERG